MMTMSNRLTTVDSRRPLTIKNQMGQIVEHMMDYDKPMAVVDYGLRDVRQQKQREHSWPYNSRDAATKYLQGLRLEPLNFFLNYLEFSDRKCKIPLGSLYMVPMLRPDLEQPIPSTIVNITSGEHGEIVVRFWRDSTSNNKDEQPEA
ncbi:hypothetical protein PVK06_025026 [Gossypium arboreum]|uniref:Uncharacterized protein n=1 Tax=Gossypium arboreum TaxID=29729 RepID=A0ABR0PFP5_GOSAR|nr:hypothetical protein PVK06_025026 [Gossypium arboreum]